MSTPALDRINRQHVPAEQLERGRGNVAAIRSEQEANRELQMRREFLMSNNQRTDSGIVRVNRTQAEARLSEYDELRAEFDDEIDEFDQTLRRERLMDSARGPSESDTRRASALTNRRSGR